MRSSADDSVGVSVHTGFPNPAIDQSLRGLDLNQLLIRHAASSYMFLIVGSEWEAAGVFDGDIAIVDRALTPRSSDTVIWWQGGTEQFAISLHKHVTPGATVWGVITATIHQLRKTREG